MVHFLTVIFIYWKCNPRWNSPSFFMSFSLLFLVISRLKCSYLLQSLVGWQLFYIICCQIIYCQLVFVVKLFIAKLFTAKYTIASRIAVVILYHYKLRCYFSITLDRFSKYPLNLNSSNSNCNTSKTCVNKN